MVKIERLVIVTARAAVPEEVGTDLAQLADAFLFDTLAVCLHREVRANVWLIRDSDTALPGLFAAVRSLENRDETREALARRGFADGYKYLCFIGDDTPHLPGSFLQEAFGRLIPSQVTGAGVEAVWGPTDDDRYALTAIRQPLPDLLAAATTQQAEARSQDAGLGYHLLPRWYRADNGENLQRLARDLQRGVVQAPSTAKVLAGLRV